MKYECTRCGDYKLADAFPVNDRARYGLGSWCKACQVERTRAWRAANPDKANAATRARYHADPERERARKRARYHARKAATS